jgi:hypothetical protein
LTFLANVHEAEYPNTQELAYDDSPAVRAFVRDMALPPLNEPATRAIGEPLAALGSVTPTEICAGRIVGVATVQGGVRLWGQWADLSRNTDARIIAVAADGTVVGAGVPFPKLVFPVLVPLEGLPATGGWVAYSGGPLSRNLSLYGATHDGQLICRFDMTLPQVPSISTAPS